MRTIFAALCIALFVTVAGCDDKKPQARATNGAPRPAQAAPGCVLSASGGRPGACAPRPLTGRPLNARPSGIRFVDLSNNDPVGAQGMRTIKARGYLGVIVKVNQAGYIDPYAAPMVRDARRAGLKVGGYDFADPTRVGPIQEAHIFVARARQLGICSGSDVIPPTGDIEYGSITRGYVAVWVGIVRKACGRTQVYTGQWYWNPHIGCYWPAGVRGWVSAYGVSDVHRYLPCGLGGLLLEHQYTDREFNGANTGDASVFFGSRAQWDAYTGARPRPLRPPSPFARLVCRRLNTLRHHTRSSRAVRREVRIDVRFMRAHHLSCYRNHVRRVR